MLICTCHFCQGLEAGGVCSGGAPCCICESHQHESWWHFPKSQGNFIWTISAIKKLQDPLKHGEPTKVRIPGCLLQHNTIGNCLAFSSHYLSFCSAKTSLLFGQIGEQPMGKCHFPKPDLRHLCFLHLGEQESQPRKLNSPGKGSMVEDIGFKMVCYGSTGELLWACAVLASGTAPVSEPCCVRSVLCKAPASVRHMCLLKSMKIKWTLETVPWSQ